MPKKKKQLAEALPVAEAAAPVTAPAEEEEETEDDVDDSSDSKTSFRFYVGQVCKETVKRDPRYKAVRVSTAIRGYLSNLLVEFIQRLSSLVHLTATNMKNKTINDVAILRTVEALLIDGHATHEVIEYKDAMVLDPAVLKAESAKREEEKKAGREYKVDLDKVPKVPGVVAVRTVSYPTSGYSLLASKVEEKLKLYETLGEKEKAALVNESA
jgi:histone H3/H4